MKPVPIHTAEARTKTVLRFLILLLLAAPTTIYAHGGKHAESEFTHLQALKKATELNDKLIGGNKLDQSWETALEKVQVSERTKDNRTEVVVAFHRAEGDPNTVYIFFTQDGQYAGSNFTGE